MLARTLRLVLLFLKLLFCESKLFLCALYFIHELLFVKGLFTDNLALKVLYLRIKTLFNRIVFFSHDLSPDRVEFVEDLTNAGFTHGTTKLIPYLEDSSHGFSWNPVIVFCFLSTALGFRTTLHRVTCSGG